MRARQDLAVGRLRYRSLDEAEATHIRHALGHIDVDEHAMCRHGEAPSGCSRSIPEDDTVRRPREDASISGCMMSNPWLQGRSEKSHRWRTMHAKTPLVRHDRTKRAAESRKPTAT